MNDVDYIEVGRQAHQLESTHGRDAWMYARRYAEEAARREKSEEAAFWRAVQHSLEPR